MPHTRSSNIAIGNFTRAYYPVKAPVDVTYKNTYECKILRSLAC